VLGSWEVSLRNGKRLMSVILVIKIDYMGPHGLARGVRQQQERLGIKVPGTGTVEIVNLTKIKEDQPIFCDWTRKLPRGIVFFSPFIV